MAIFLMSWLISLILAPWPDSHCPQLGCLDAVEAAQGCEDPLRGTETGTEAGQLRAEAQDVCHQLLEGPFRECHTQVWMGVEVASGIKEVTSARVVPNGAPGPATKLLWVIGTCQQLDQRLSAA